MITRVIFQNVTSKVLIFIFLIIVAVSCGSPQERLDRLKGQLATLEKEKVEIEEYHTSIISSAIESQEPRDNDAAAIVLASYSNEVSLGSGSKFAEDIANETNLFGTAIVFGTKAVSPTKIPRLKKELKPAIKKLKKNKQNYTQVKKEIKRILVKIYSIIKSNYAIVSDEEKDEIEKILELEYQLDLDEL